MLLKSKPTGNENIKRWYALQTKPRQEFKAESNLKAQGIENYLPVIIRNKNWSDRVKKIMEPIIRGYIFIRSDETERLKAIELESVSKCLFDQGKPAVIPEWQIDNLKRMLKVKSHFKVYEGLIEGTRIKIANGPFAGVIGIIQSSSDKKIFAVSIDLLNRSVITHLPKESIDVIRIE